MEQKKRERGREKGQRGDRVRADSKWSQHVGPQRKKHKKELTQFSLKEKPSENASRDLVGAGKSRDFALLLLFLLLLLLLLLISISAQQQ